MPSQRKSGKVKFGFWITEAEKKAIEADMKRLKIKTYTEYIKYRCGIENLPDDQAEDD